MADAIFISYRRDDSEGEAGRLFDDLTRAFGTEAVFMDVTGIKPGVDFRKAIEQNVASCGVLLAIIGPAWLTAADAEGKHRLDDANDFVVLEIASALRREVPVIPVLVHDAKMPPPDRLPESIANLAYHNGVEISHARWSSDVALLIEALKSYVSPPAVHAADQPAPIHATVPVQFPPSHSPAERPNSVPLTSRVSFIVGALLASSVIVGGVVYESTKSRHASAEGTPSPTPVVTPSGHPVKQADAAALSPAQAVTTKSSNASGSKTSTTEVPVRATSASASPGLVGSLRYVGTWRRSGSQGGNDTLTRLVIVTSGSGIAVHAYGGCDTPVCDWGSQPATVENDGDIVATFSPSPTASDISRTARITVHAVPEGLDVLVQNTFQNPTGTRQNAAHRLFVSAN